MFMLATLLLTSLIVMALCAVILSGVDPEDRHAAELQIEVEPPRFFAGDSADQRIGQVPIHVVLSQVARHVQLEQAAAERFVHVPSREALHEPTATPFVN